MKRMPEVTAEFKDRGDKEKVALVWDGCCRDLKVGKATSGRDSVLRSSHRQVNWGPLALHLL